MDPVSRGGFDVPPCGIDIFLITSRRGVGLGTEAIRVLIRNLFEERGHHRLAIDPAADNAAAICAFTEPKTFGNGALDVTYRPAGAGQ